MTDSSILLPTGQSVNSQAIPNAASQTVYRETMTLGDPTSIAAIQAVKAGGVAPVASDGAAVVVKRPDTVGSVGKDYSASPPALPNVSANFPNSGTYANWVLIGAVPASYRNKVTIDNMSVAQILVIRDDGTASPGSARANATAFTLNPKVVTGPEGGHWESTTFFGRLQIYALSSSAFVAVAVD